MKIVASRGVAALLLAWHGLAPLASAFLPPLPAIVREIFDGRKPRPSYEISLRHEVELKPGEVVELQERVIVIRGKRYTLWRVGSESEAASVDRDGYRSEAGKTYPSRSSLWLKYFTAPSGEDFLGALVAEGFARKEQFQQFKAGWTPEGEPKEWDVKNAYVRHEDIYLSRLRRGVSIAVKGADDGGTSKVVYFDQGLRGVRRLEWREGERVAAWEFDDFHQPVKELGLLPKRCYFEAEGTEKVRSEVTAVRMLSDRQVQEAQAALRSATTPLSGNGEAALQLVLSYR